MKYVIVENQALRAKTRSSLFFEKFRYELAQCESASKNGQKACRSRSDFSLPMALSFHRISEDSHPLETLIGCLYDGGTSPQAGVSDSQPQSRILDHENVEE